MATKIGCIGGGNIVRAMLSGVDAGDKGFSPSEVGIFDINQHVLDAYAAKGYQTYASITELVQNSRIVLVAVLPQVIRSITPELRDARVAGNVFLSVPPGITTGWFEENLGADVKSVQCTPTLTAQVGMGAYSIDASKNLAPEDYAEVRAFLESSGIVEDIPGDKMAEVTPIAGCAPAYFYHMADVVVREAVAMGLDEKASLNLFAQTMKGSAEMLLNIGDETPKDLEKKLLLPGAATLMAINKMVELGFDEAITEGIKAAVAQCAVLGKQ